MDDAEPADTKPDGMGGPPEDAPPAPDSLPIDGGIQSIERQVEVWKTVVGVQQHFNDIELRIISLALTVLTAILGAAALSFKDNTKIDISGAHVPMSVIIFAAGMILWLAFYFVHQIWYHRLLIGAVRQGEAIEDSLHDLVPGIGLTKRISAESAYKYQFFGERELHSMDKLKIFYYTVFIVLALLCFASLLGGVSPAAQSCRNSTTAIPHVNGAHRGEHPGMDDGRCPQGSGRDSGDRTCKPC